MPIITCASIHENMNTTSIIARDPVEIVDSVISSSPIVVEKRQPKYQK